MKVARNTVLPVTPAEVWDVVGDPYNLPRWWPRIDRVESMDGAGFTEVYRTKKGRWVRADFRIAALDEAQEIRVVQQLDGTPFQRIFSASSKRTTLVAEGDGTKVTLELDQTPVGMARLGALSVRKAMRAQLDEALAGLRELLVPG